MMQKKVTNLLLGLVSFAMLLPGLSHASQIVEEGYTINDPSHKWFNEVKKQPDLTIDHVHGNSFEVWGPAGLGNWLKKNNVQFQSATETETEKSFSANYPSHQQITTALQGLASAHPETAKLFSIGKSVEGRDLWVMKVSRNVKTDDSRPEFKYVANMHGDEIVGREVMIKLIQELLEQDGQDPVITKLLDQTQIYILPSMNPDGAARQTRGTAKSIDLNRDFPDFNSSDNINSPDGRGLETQLVMKWQASRKFKLSANFHGGAEVVNYPWDAIPDAHPLDAYVKGISLGYAKLAPYISASTAFENGITNGYAWYLVNGGMQDWSYHWYNDIQLTIELSNNKWPAYSSVDYYWKQNRDALLYLINQVNLL